MMYLSNGILKTIEFNQPISMFELFKLLPLIPLRFIWESLDELLKANQISYDTTRSVYVTR